ncbi:CHASE3 domain-containing protein [Paenibacillus sp. HJGM_3]|uniref:CHASE3 domain-containing protein n=1 Tax=Paenibacillus sp. HJGM_3 TaxID=3379816 RepID=UPI00385F9FD3
MGKRWHFSIRAKMMLGYIFVILCLGVTILIVVDRIGSRQEAIDYITDHDLQVHNLINRMEKVVLDMETGQRGFIITGDERYLDPYKEGSQIWMNAYMQLHGLLADNPSQQATLETVKPLLDNWIQTSGEVSIRLKRENRSAELLEWFKQDPGKPIIDQIRASFDTIRGTESKLTEARAEGLKDDYRNLTIVLFVLLSLISVVSLAVALFISGVIVRTIRQVIRAIQHIASSKADMTERVEVRTRDEIQELADATNRLLDNLGEENWVQTNIAEVATQFQGIHHLTDLSEAIVGKLAPLLGAGYGVLYLNKEQSGQPLLTKMGAYAGSEGDPARISFKPGEGLVGQCALDKQVLLLQDVPETYIRVSSGLGQAAPRSILIAPIVFEGHVEAVLEFASFDEFEPRHVSLLKQLLDPLGAMLNSVRSRVEIERLLNESQMLTEELQAQSEELQAQSEELQMQQEQLRQSNEFLEEHNHYVEQKAAELKRAKEELEEYSVQLERSSQYKSDFLANMSHELRTPLNSILILSQLLAENEEGRLSNEEEDYSRVIYTAGKDLLALIDDILDLSKVEAGKIDIMVDEVNLTELPQLLKLVFEPIAQQKGLSFQVESDPNVPDLMLTDGQRLQQVLKNLLSNAFKFTDHGSVSFRVERIEAARVQHLLPVQPDELVVAFSISDTGIGIPADKQKLIFEAFQQADGTTNRQYGGTGLGLSICREFSRLLGGCITVESSPGEGSTFTLILPEFKTGEPAPGPHREVAATAEAVGPTEADPPFKPSAVPLSENGTAGSIVDEATGQADVALFAGKRVLLVDDDARNVFALVTALESKQVTVEVAENGRQALDKLRESQNWDLVLMDIMMPVMDGYEAMQAIRKELELKELPIIALTAKAMKNAREQCLAAGASDYISKPLNLEQLYSLMRVWLTK